MKTYFTISMIFLGLNLLNAQNYIPFPDSNAIWRVNFYDIGCPYPLIQPTYQYLTTGDTIINSISYVKITRSGICNMCCPAPWGSQNGYIGAYRQDILNKKVFFVFTGNSNDELIYDFELNVGDTVKGILPIEPLIIISIDSVLLSDSVYHKRFNGEYNMFSLIEGIGSDQGLLEPIAIQEPPGMLVCFKENGHTIYPAGVDSCPLTTAVQNHRQSLQIPTIYPDPADRFLNINIDNPSNSNFILLIYNTLGDLLSSNTVNGNSFKLDISSFSTSVYFYRLIESTSKQVYTGKFIKD